MNPLNLFSRDHKLRQRLEAMRPRLYRLAYSWTMNPALADDLTQDTLTKGLKKVAQLKNPDALEGWLFGILRNCWRDHYRSHRDMDELDHEQLTDEFTPEHHHEQQHIVTKVRSAVAQLAEGQREVLTLVDLEGFSYAEVAQSLDIPIGTVMSRLCRARKALAERLLSLDPPEQIKQPEQTKKESPKKASHIRRII
ncbi:MAG TPA: sigma-70 family RNA polymerase sigma factor [Gammaproteobacteria bacterium]|nr:sigma-70 family RNA polymerase sigma factor [Gammaproteobacteria bacterium]